MKNISGNPEVCFFDSGIGGLNLLYECVRKLPRVNFTYFADNFHVPYGSLSNAEMLERVDGYFKKIEQRSPSAAVIACNTVTAQCIEYLRKKYEFEILGIQPAIKPASAFGNCLVLATPSTAASNSLKRLAEKYGGEKTKITACDKLAAYIEENVFNLSEEKVKSFLPNEKADAVVLGCTHYIYCKEIIKKLYGCAVFDGIEGTADHLCNILGIFDHQAPRAQKIAFEEGNSVKNRRVFNYLVATGGGLSQNFNA